MQVMYSGMEEDSMMMPVGRNIPPSVFTRDIRAAIKQRAANDPEMLAYIMALEEAVMASDQLMQSHDETTRCRVRVSRCLVPLDFLK